jgi:hypothetical protein
MSKKSQVLIELFEKTGKRSGAKNIVRLSEAMQSTFFFLVSYLYHSPAKRSQNLTAKKQPLKKWHVRIC